MFPQLCSAQRRTYELMKTSCSQRRSKIPPITGNLLILGFNFAVSPRRVCCSRLTNSFVQFMKSVLMKALPRSCTLVWKVVEECIHFSTAEIVAWTPLFVTGCTISNRANASITKKQWKFGLLGESSVSMWSMWIVRNGIVSFCFSSDGTSPLFGFRIVILACEAVSSRCKYPV